MRNSWEIAKVYREKINPPTKETGIKTNEENLTAKARANKKEERKNHKSVFFLESQLNNFKKMPKEASTHI